MASLMPSARYAIDKHMPLLSRLPEQYRCEVPHLERMEQRADAACAAALFVPLKCFVGLQEFSPDIHYIWCGQHHSTRLTCVAFCVFLRSATGWFGASPEDLLKKVCNPGLIGNNAAPRYVFQVCASLISVHERLIWPYEYRDFL